MKHLLRLLLFVLLGAADLASQEPPPPTGPPDALDSLTFSSELQAVLDSIRGDMDLGRNWRAVRRFREHFPNGPEKSEELVLLLAGAEAGWSNWTEVGALLQGALDGGVTNDPEAWYLLGRALEEDERWEEAESAYGRVLTPERNLGRENGWKARARRARIRVRLGRYAEALSDAEELARGDPGTAGWIALELAERTANEGAREETRQALSMVARDEVRQLGWDLLPTALLESGDSIGAEAAFWSALPSLSAQADQAAAWDRVGALRLARGDSLGAQGAFHQVLALPSAGTAGVRAAEALLSLGFDSVGIALAGARAFAGAGRPREALEAYGIYEELGGPLTPSIRLNIARRHLNLGQGGRALPLVTELGEGEDPEVAAVALGLEVLALRQLGRTTEGRAVQDELMERFPRRPEAVEIAFARADADRNRGDLEGAIIGYRATVAMESSHNLAGQARMWMGHLLLRLGREEEALEVFGAYLNEFPDGRRADEAAYWRGRTLITQGLEVEGRDLLTHLPANHPISYYSVRAGELLGVPYSPPLPTVADSLPFPAFLRDGLERFDRLLSVGLDRAAEWEADALAAALRRDGDTQRRQNGLLRLAGELNERGFTREGINLGWEVRREERPLDRFLLAAIYPFPYREIVMGEALERGIDPYLMAGLIRQESAFWEEARSPADARGLMQVLPTTGRELARAVGPEGFRPDDHLNEAEINIHLGMAFFSDMRRRFGQDLPIILSAYNAGPTRALRWREYPEARDMHLFVERIPFTETRGYVKNVLANRAIYAWLYGS